MITKKLFSIIFLSLALGALAMPMSASACGKHKHHHKVCYSCCCKMKHCRMGLVRGECQTIPGHWWTTVWVPEKKACWYIKS